jgi:hypothetical protein
VHAKTPLAEVFYFLPGNGARKFLLLFDGAQLTREIILLRSPATAPKNCLDGCSGFIFSPSSWEPQEEGMMSIAARFFPQLRNQGLSFRRGANKRLKVMLASL